MKRFLVFWAVFSIFLSCSKEHIEPEQKIESPSSLDSIIGKWDIRYPDAPDRADLIWGHIEFLADSTIIFTNPENHIVVGEFKVTDPQSIRLPYGDSLSNITIRKDSLHFKMSIGETYNFLAIKDRNAVALGASSLLCRDWLLSKEEGGLEIYEQENHYSENEIVAAKVVFSPSGHYFWRYYKEDGKRNSSGVTNWDWHSAVDNALLYWDPRVDPDNSSYHSIYELTDSTLVMSSPRTNKKLYLTPVRN